MGVTEILAAATISCALAMAGASFSMPSENDAHLRTVLGWPTANTITGSESYPGAKSDVNETWNEIASLAKAIAKYEPVSVYVQSSSNGSENSMYLKAARALLGRTENVTIHYTPNVESLWLRDTGPIIVRSQNGSIKNSWGPNDNPGLGFNTTSTDTKTVALSLNFNQWGRKTEPTNDSYTAEMIGQSLGMSVVRGPFTAEGGGIETDGEGTFIGTESSILNPNRNPGIDKATIEGYLQQYLGIRKAIWLPGTRGADITDDHIDGIARFARPGVVFLSKPFVNSSDDPDAVLAGYNEAKDRLSKGTDAKGRKLTLVDLPEPSYAVLGEDVDLNSGPSVSYVNFLVANGAVILAKFGDDEYDAQAKKIVAEQFPGRKVEQVYLHQIAIQGGGIHCSTQQIPA